MLRILYANFKWRQTTNDRTRGQVYKILHWTRSVKPYYKTIATYTEPSSRLRCLRRFFLLLFTFTTQKQMVSSHAIKELLQFFHVTLSLWDDTFDKKFPLGTINCTREKSSQSVLDINHEINFNLSRDSNAVEVLQKIQ